MPEPLDCEAAIRRLWDYLDGALPAQEEAAVRDHVEACVHCRPHADFERAFLRELGKVRREHDDPAALEAGVLDALRKAGFRQE